MLRGNLTNLLIVESDNGQVYFVENEKQGSKLEEIRKRKKIQEENAEKKRRKEEAKRKHENDDKFKSEIKEEPFEDPATISYECLPSVSFVEVAIKQDSSDEDEDESSFDEKSIIMPYVAFPKSGTNSNATESKFESTFSGNWSDEDDEPLSNLKDDFDFHPPSPEVKKQQLPRRVRAKIFREKLTDAELRAGGVAFGKHKMRKLVGVPACRYCDSIFVNRKERNAHDCVYLKCDPKNFICRFCGKELSKKTFSNHVHEAAECQYCGKKLLNPRQMKKHIETRHKDEDYKPPLQRRTDEIEKYIQEKQKAEAHVYQIREQLRAEEELHRLHNLHEYRKNPRYQCDKCGKREPSKRELTNHINQHLDIPLGVCPKCGLKIFTADKLRRHCCMPVEKRKPFGAPNHKYCRYCGNHFETVELNRSHKCPFVNLDDPKHVICRFCSKCIAKSDFGHHMERHKDHPNQCFVCNQTFLYKRGLRIHLKLHTGEKLYKCELCGTTFNYKQNYDHHIKTHGITGGKNIPCEFCGKSFSTEVTLKNHKARAHEINLKCETCRLPMQSREVLLKHMETVHGPLTCENCNMSFLEPRKLKIHMYKHYEPDPSNRVDCEFCAKTMSRGRMRRHIYKDHHEQFETWSAANSETV